MAGGPDFDRIKEYLRRWAGDRSAGREGYQRPHYPLFPGLRHAPFHDPAEHPAVAILEREFAAIRAEALALDQADEFDYSRAARGTLGDRSWTLYPFHHMGVEVERLAGRCPRTLAILDVLPRACLGYVWGDSLFSAMKGGASLPPHCSVDNLRLRLHLGLVVPEGCGIRVAAETREWREGSCLAFEDSFEHEVWNRSTRRRVVLIVDLWHPDLTELEIRALRAAFGKSQVRGLFLHERIGVANAPAPVLQHIRATVSKQDDASWIKEFWPERAAEHRDDGVIP
jgi:aspartyl/asparaginyl beta-hydroxylase (cupin superfamily)